jgi:predicted Mrr-cat superfamily restriction endonuclease
LLESRVDLLVSIVNVCSCSSSSEDNFARDEDEDDYFKLHDSIDEAWEDLRFVVAESSMGLVKFLKHDREAYIMRSDHVLHFEESEPNLEP